MMAQTAIAYALNAAWQVPLIAAIAWVLARLAWLEPAERCWLWVASLAIAVVTPALRLAAPAPAVAAILPPAPAPAALLVPTAPAAVHASAWTIHFGRSEVEILLVLLGLASALAVVRLGLGLLAARRILRGSSPAQLSAPLIAQLARFAAARGMKPPSVRTSPRISVPIAIGIRSPAIILPADFERHGAEAIGAALLHECAHLARRDFAINLACESLALPLAWHPATHALKAGLRSSREIACDRLAASHMASPSQYARCLVALARSMAEGPSTDPALAAPALLRPGELERRIRDLARWRGVERSPSARRPAAAVSAVLVLALTAAIGLRIEPAFAQPVTNPPAPSPMPSPTPPVSPVAEASPPATETPPPAHEAGLARGETRTVTLRKISEDPPLSDAARRRLEDEAARAKAEAAAAEAVIRSPEFRRQIEEARRQALAAVDDSAVRRQIDEGIAEARRQAVAATDDPAVRRRIEEAMAKLNDPAVQQALARAEAAAANVDIRRTLDEAARALKQADDAERQAAQAQTQAQPQP